MLDLNNLLKKEAMQTTQGQQSATLMKWSVQIQGASHQLMYKHVDVLV